jgi:hypothetical protein
MEVNKFTLRCIKHEQLKFKKQTQTVLGLSQRHGRFSKKKLLNG